MTTSTSRVSRSMPGRSAIREGPPGVKVGRIVYPAPRRAVGEWRDMSVARRRAASALAAILLLAVAFAYTGWQLHLIGQEGWAGLSYYPPTSKSKNETRPLPSFLMRPGTIMM